MNARRILTENGMSWPTKSTALHCLSPRRPENSIRPIKFKIVYDKPLDQSMQFCCQKVDMCHHAIVQ